MKLVDIRESGSNHMLKMAIEHDKDIKNIREDEALMSLINDQLFYLVRLNNINQFELLRLSQIFREKLRILNSSPADIPALADLREIFPGSSKTDEEKENKDVLPLADAAHYIITNFINLTSQMEADSDIISLGTAQLFLPMITRKYDVQIPLSFIDFVESMNPDEIEELFTEEYPDNLNNLIEKEVHSLKTMISIGFVKLTDIIKYNNRYDTLLKEIIYSPLNIDKRNLLYKVIPISFSKYDKINRSIEKCILYNNPKEQLEKSMKRISKIKNTLEVEFVIQLPLYHMQLLLNSTDNTSLQVQYHSSMKSIIDNGLVYEDFKSSAFVDDETEEGQVQLQTHEEAVSSYRTRITEANQIMLNSIPLMLKSDNDISASDVFSLLPAIYKSNAVVKYVYDNDYPEIDLVLDSLFEDMKNITSGIIEDISKLK